MMPADSDRAAPRKTVLCAGSLPVVRTDYSQPGHPRSVHGDGTLCDHSGGVRIADAPAQGPRPFADIRDDLVRLAGAGIVSPRVRVRTERAVAALAGEAARSPGPLTARLAADWLGAWLPPEGATAEDWAALRRVVALLRSAP